MGGGSAIVSGGMSGVSASMAQKTTLGAPFEQLLVTDIPELDVQGLGKAPPKK